MMDLRSYARQFRLARRLYAWSYALKRLAPLRSYAQAEEDLIAERLLGQVNYFVDIGAHDGISGSNTFYFARQGAAGVCFEPVRWTYQKLEALYAWNPRVRCRNIGISDKSGNQEIVAADFLSYLPETEDVSHSAVNPHQGAQRETIRLLTFSEAVAGLPVPDIVDLVSVDVEGHELNVLRSIPFDRFRFRCFIVETHLQNADGSYKWKHRDLDAIESLLRAHGFEAAGTTWVNTLYLRK